MNNFKAQKSTIQLSRTSIFSLWASIFSFSLAQWTRDQASFFLIITTLTNYNRNTVTYVTYNTILLLTFTVQQRYTLLTIQFNSFSFSLAQWTRDQASCLSTISLKEQTMTYPGQENLRANIFQGQAGIKVFFEPCSYLT